MSVLTRADVKEACFARVKDAVLSPARTRQTGISSSAGIWPRIIRGAARGGMSIGPRNSLCNSDGRAALYCKNQKWTP